MAAYPRVRSAPSPSVDSAILTIVPRPIPLLSPAAYPDYDAFLRAAFSGRGNTLARRLGVRPAALRRARAPARRDARVDPTGELRARLPIGSRFRRLPDVRGGVSMKRVVLFAAMFVLAFAAPAVAAGPSPGAPGIGDPLFPGLGNGGYDVQHYDVDVRYGTRVHRPGRGQRARSSRARRRRSRASTSTSRAAASAASSSTARPRTWRRDGLELVITPRKAIAKGALFVVTVSKFVAVPTVPERRPVVHGAVRAPVRHGHRAAARPRALLPAVQRPPARQGELRLPLRRPGRPHRRRQRRPARASGRAAGARTPCSSSASRWPPS